MILHGVYSRMQDGERWRPFRNQAQIVVSEACMTYSTRPMAGETKRTKLPIQWHGDTAFSVDWSAVCRRWGKAATFRAHVENGVRGLEEQARHFGRYERAATQKMQENRRSHEARTPKSRSVPSRPPGASNPDDDVATAKTAALSSPTTPRVLQDLFGSLRPCTVRPRVPAVDCGGRDPRCGGANDP